MFRPGLTCHPGGTATWATRDVRLPSPFTTTFQPAGTLGAAGSEEVALPPVEVCEVACAGVAVDLLFEVEAELHPPVASKVTKISAAVAESREFVMGRL